MSGLFYDATLSAGFKKRKLVRKSSARSTSSVSERQAERNWKNLRGRLTFPVANTATTTTGAANASLGRNGQSGSLGATDATSDVARFVTASPTSVRTTAPPSEPVPLEVVPQALDLAELVMATVGRTRTVVVVTTPRRTTTPALAGRSNAAAASLDVVMVAVRVVKVRVGVVRVDHAVVVDHDADGASAGMLLA